MLEFSWTKGEGYGQETIHSRTDYQHVSGSDFAVNIESSMPPGENLLHKGETDELFIKQKRENFMGKELLNKVIIEVGDTVEGTI